SDNKGFAQYLLETKYSSTGLVAAFFQTDSADVSPNMKDNPSTINTTWPTFMGEGKDYIESCEIIGRKQAITTLEPLVDGRRVYQNFSSLDTGEVKTCPAMAGLSIYGGTEDGRGPICIREGWSQNTLDEVLSLASEILID